MNIDKFTAAIKNVYNLISHKISFFYKKLITSIRINYPHIKVRIKKIFPYFTTEEAFEQGNAGMAKLNGKCNI